MKYHVNPCNTMQYHAIPCNSMQYHAIPCNTMQYHAIPCNTMQWHAIPEPDPKPELFGQTRPEPDPKSKSPTRQGLTISRSPSEFPYSVYKVALMRGMVKFMPSFRLAITLSWCSMPIWKHKEHDLSLKKDATFFFQDLSFVFVLPDEFWAQIRDCWLKMSLHTWHRMCRCRVSQDVPQRFPSKVLQLRIWCSVASPPAQKYYFLIQLWDCDSAK